MRFPGLGRGELFGGSHFPPHLISSLTAARAATPSSRAAWPLSAPPPFPRRSSSRSLVPSLRTTRGFFCIRSSEKSGAARRTHTCVTPPSVTPAQSNIPHLRASRINYFASLEKSQIPSRQHCRSLRRPACPELPRSRPRTPTRPIQGQRGAHGQGGRDAQRAHVATLARGHLPTSIMIAISNAASASRHTAATIPDQRIESGRVIPVPQFNDKAIPRNRVARPLRARRCPTGCA